MPPVSRSPGTVGQGAELRLRRARRQGGPGGQTGRSTDAGRPHTKGLMAAASTAGTYPVSSYRVYSEGSNGSSTLAGTTFGLHLPGGG
jgi:hypothetical protein